MSLVGTLAKVAIGIAVSKGLKNMVGGGSTRRSSGGGLGDLLGGALGGGSSSSGGGLGDLLGGALGGGSSKSGGGLGDLLGGALGGAKGGSSGGIGDLLGSVLGGGGSPRSGGTGLEDLMGSVLKGNSANTNGGLGDILGQLGGGSAGGGGIGDLLTNALENKGQVTQKTTQADEDAAGLIIRAMIQAAKADGTIDEDEKEHLVGHLGDLSQDEIRFINGEMGRQIDIKGLARDVPNGMESQVYMMSLMGIHLDTQGEASYLNDLAQSMNLGKEQVNQIHHMVGVDPLYR